MKPSPTDWSLRPPSVLLACLFCGILAGGLRAPLAWTVVSVLIWAIACARPGSASSSALRPWLPWLAWAALAALASNQPLKCLPALSRWATLVAFFALARTLWGEEERERWLGGLLMSGLICGLAALWTGHGVPLMHGDTMTGLLPPYYNYTMFVEAAAAGGLLALLARREGAGSIAPRWALWLLLAFCLAVLLIARARGALLAVAFAGVVVAARRRQAKPLLALGGLLLAGAVLVTGAALARGLSPAYLLKPEWAASFKRPAIWRSAVLTARESPWLGTGPGNFEQGFLRHNFVSGREVANYQYTTAYAHSELFQALAAPGCAGLLLLLQALWASVRPAYGGAAAGNAHEDTPARDAAFGAFAAMGAQSLVDNMWHLPALGLLFFSALACALPKGGASRGVTGLYRAALLAGLALALSAWLPEWLVSANETLAGRGIPGARRVELARESARIFPGDYYRHELLARAYLFTEPPDAPRAMEELETASRLNPTNALLPELEGEILRLSQDWAGVLARTERALALEPNFLNARLLRAEALARLGRRSEARAELAEVIRLRGEIDSAGPRRKSGYGAEVEAFDQRRFDQIGALVR